MPDQHLPVYHIQHFKETLRHNADFYLKTLEAHLGEHAFIQKPHKHNFYLLILFTRGTGTHTIDFQTYDVKPGNMFFLRPGQVHSWELSAAAAGYVLFFSLEFYLFGHSQKKFDSLPFFNSWQSDPVLPLAGNELLTVKELFGKLELENNDPDWGQADLLRNYLDILLIKLARIYSQVYGAGKTNSANISGIQQVISLIDKYYKLHKPVSFYADNLSITGKQLNELSKNTFDKTFTDLLHDRLILEAQRLLIHSDLTITQLAAELGYFDNSYFARFFKKHTGKTPEQFRLSLQ